MHDRVSAGINMKQVLQWIGVTAAMHHAVGLLRRTFSCYFNLPLFALHES